MPRRVVCPYESLGCVVQLRCKDLGQHLQDGAFMHLRSVWAETKRRTDKLESQTNAIASQVSVINNAVLGGEVIKFKHQMDAQTKAMATMQKELAVWRNTTSGQEWEWESTLRVGVDKNAGFSTTPKLTRS
uniref:TRAF-type domain-containing protein n=1 Tax=Pyramimonas obovata TaxID=1411642 RepID=A0A7S0WMM6_9CHLO